MRLKLMISAVALINFLDALTTYILVVSGGWEVNPLISDIVNSDPAAVFLIHILATAAVAVLFAVADKISRRLPAAVYTKLWNYVYAVFTVSAVYRSLIVINNAMGITMHTTPLVDFLMNT